MCTYATERVSVRGSGKGRDGWFRLTDASVYLDHPYHADGEHTLNIDFLNPQEGAATAGQLLTPALVRARSTRGRLAARSSSLPE
jgi:hypothetical protein